jgi:hypothetical protein
MLNRASEGKITTSHSGIANKVKEVWDKHKTDMSLIYAAALVLIPGYLTRYFETHWLKKWSKPILAKVNKLWEKYRKEIIIFLTISAFSYDNSFYMIDYFIFSRSCSASE